MGYSVVIQNYTKGENKDSYPLNFKRPYINGC